MPMSGYAISGLLLGVASGIALAAWERLRRRRQLQAFASALTAVASGDLRVDFGVHESGPYASLAKPCAAVVQQLREALSCVDVVRTRLGVRWHDVNDVAWQMLETSEVSAAQALGVVSSAEQVSSSIHSIASATEQLGATIRDVAVHASEASSVAMKGAEQVVAADATVTQLEEASRRIEKVVELITQIASQTHLLSLNATIEAARAGEAGRGFAIVAGEVKDLAMQTATATGNVSESVHAIQSGATRAAAAMSSVTETISLVSSNQVAIATAVEQQNAATTEIGRSSAVAAEGSSGLVAHVNGLLRTMRTTAYAGAHGRTLAADLAILESMLSASVDRYDFQRVHIDNPDDVATVAVATTANGVTTVPHNVIGSGINQWEYTEFWRHSTENVESDGTNAYSSMPGDVATLRFRGSKVRLFGFVETNHGIGTVSIDGGPAIPFDLFGGSRARTVLFDSGHLPPGEHTLSVVVTGEKNPQSRYIWISLEKAEIVG